MSARKRIFIAIAVSLVTVLACLCVVLYSVMHKNLPAPEKAYVSSTHPTTAQWQPYIRATGTLTASAGITVKTETSGRITKINFKSGQHVKKGDLLVQLDKTEQQGKFEYAKAQLALSKVTYLRDKKLYRKGAVSKEAYDTAYSNMRADKGSLEEAQSDLDKTAIRAHFDGILGIRQVSIGEYLETGDEIVELQQLNPMFIDFDIPETFLESIHPGQTIAATLSSFPNTVFKGAVLALNASISSDSSSITVRASIPNPKQKLRSGGFAMIKLYYGQPKTVLTVPQIAIVYSDTGNYVYKIKNHHAIVSYVTLGEQIGQSIIVTKGLTAKDTIVLAGTNKIHNGSPVIVKNTDHASNQAGSSTQ